MSKTEDEKPVGYKSPPAWTRFKPGQSGNPSGRPKKIKSLKVELVEELEQFTDVTENGQKLQITKARAIAKALVQAAAGGNLRATTTLLSLFARDPVDTQPTDETTPEDRALLDEFVDRELRRRAGETSSNNPDESQQKED